MSISKLNQLFINQNYVEDVVDFLNLIGYNPNYFAHTGSVDKMVKDFTAKSQFNPSHHAISAYMDNTHTTVYITLNPMQYPVTQLIERIKKVAKKHNKTLEVNI